MPVTFNHLFDRLCSVENLFRAAHKASLGKRDKPCVNNFGFDLERQVWRLHEELHSGRYQPGPYRSFWITDPKKRLISAAPFRDRVVHHAICNIVEPLWERRFISESFANRRGKGTSLARDHFARGMLGHPFVVRCDVRKFFPSMDHAVLKAQFRRVVACRPTLTLLDRVVEASNAQEPVAWYFAGDDLWTPFQRTRGLPLGNQTSQFFANVYLDPVDHFVKEDLRCRHYVRYVDDLALFAPDRGVAEAWLARLAMRLGEQRLHLHAGKSRVWDVREGVTFLGVRFAPGARRLASENVRRARRRLRGLARDYRVGRVTRDDVSRSWRGWCGHAREARAIALIGRVRNDFRAWVADGEKEVSRGAGRRLEQPSIQRPLRQPEQESTHEQEHR